MNKWVHSTTYSVLETEIDKYYVSREQRRPVIQWVAFRGGGDYINQALREVRFTHATRFETREEAMTACERHYRLMVLQ